MFFKKSPSVINALMMNTKKVANERKSVGKFHIKATLFPLFLLIIALIQLAN